MYVRRFVYKPEDVDCKLCTEYRGKHPCPHAVCPYIAERIEAGVVTYQEAIQAMIPASCKMSQRLPKLIHSYPDSFWSDPRHKRRMELFNNQLGYIPKRNTPSYYAAMYLLTANDPIHRRTANCFYHGGIEFHYAALTGISPHNYALYCAACGLRSNAKCVTLAEMADPDIIDDEAFRLIVNAMLIAKYGMDALNLKKGAV